MMDFFYSFLFASNRGIRDNNFFTNLNPVYKEGK